MKSLIAKSRIAALNSALDRAGKKYNGEFERELAVALKAQNLDEANAISAEIERVQDDLAAGRTGYVNLLSKIDPAKWQIVSDGLRSSGEGEERIEIPYFPPDEYDFHVQFSVGNSNGPVIQILSQKGAPFIWAMGSDNFTFQYIKGTGIGSNKTRVKSSLSFRSGRKFDAVVRVRRNGAEAFVENRAVSKWETDFSDVAREPW